MSNDERTGFLVRMGAKQEQLDLPVEIGVVRSLECDELKSIEANSSLLNTYTHSWEWADISRRCQEFASIIAETTDTANKSSGVPNQSSIDLLGRRLRELLIFAESWIERLNELTETRQQPSQILDLLTATIARLTSTGAYSTALHLLEDDQSRPLLSVDLKAITPLSFRIVMRTATTVQAAEIATELEVGEFVARLMFELSPLASIELTLVSEDIHNACVELRSLFAECGYCMPVIMDTAQFESYKTSGQLSFNRLPLEAIEPVMAAVRQAHRHVERFRQVSTRPNATPPATVTAPPSNTAAGDGGEAESVATTSTSTPNTPPPENPPLMLQQLLEEARTLPEDIEQRWSHALSAALEADNSLLLHRLLSLMNGIRQSLEARNKHLVDMGIKSEEFFLPSGQRYLDTLIEDPPPDALRAQTFLAEVHGIHALGTSFHALRSPSKATFRIPDESSVSWWASGALEQSRNLAAELYELHIEASEELLSTSDSNHDTSRRNYWIYESQRAQWCLHNGEFDGALLHCARAVALIRKTAEDDAANESQLFRSRLEPLNKQAASLLSLTTKITRGEPVRSATIVCLAYFWTSKFAEWQQEGFHNLNRALQANRQAEQTERESPSPSDDQEGRRNA